MIETRQLSRHFGSLVAVDNLNLQLKPGELFGFLGPNGAGKTTTMRMIVGLLRPTAGTVLVAGHDVRTDPLAVKKVVGYLAQTPHLYDKLTGREFLRFLGGLYGLTDDESDRRAGQLFEMIDLAEKADALIESYSGGMRHKIGLCAALLHRPRVLVLDEPLAGLDPYSARQVKDVLRQLCQQGVTILLSTHILEIAERVSDRVGILQRGRLVAAGTMDELRQQARAASQGSLEDLFLELTGGRQIAEVAAMLD